MVAHLAQKDGNENFNGWIATMAVNLYTKQMFEVNFTTFKRWPNNRNEVRILNLTVVNP